MERNDSILGGALLLTAANLLLRLISIAFQVFLSVRIGAAGLGLMQLISTIGVFAMLAGTAGALWTRTTTFPPSCSSACIWRRRNSDTGA